MNFLANLMPENYFKWHYNLFKPTFLVLPESKFWKKVFYILYPPHFLCFTIVLSTSEFLEVKRLFKTDFTDAMYNFCPTALHVISGIRIFLWHYMLREKYMEFVDLIDTDCDYSIFDFNDVEITEKLDKINKKEHTYEEIKTIYSTLELNLNHSTEERKEIEAYHADLHKRAKIFSVLYVLTFCFGYVFIEIALYSNAWFQGTYEEFNPRLNRTSLYRHNPFKILGYVPFDHSYSDGHHFLKIFLELYLVWGNMLPGLVLNTLGITCLLQVVVPLKVVKLALQKVDENVLATNREDQIKIINMRIVKCIHEIQRSIRCAELLEAFFSVPYMIEYAILTGILTVVLYSLLLIDNVLEYIVFGTILMLVLLDPFCLCWFSQSFSEDFLKLIPVIFQLNWKDYPPYLRRDLVFMMARLQKPVGLTLGNMIKVNLRFYVAV